MLTLQSLAPRRALGFWAIAVVLGGVTACSKTEAPQEPLRAVKVLTVTPGPLDVSGDFSGEVRARVESRLAFQVPGKLVQRPAELGQRVAAGQLLARVEAQDYQLSLQAALAQVSAAQSQRDLAAADFKRFESLRAQNFISGAELERREAALKAADSALTQAKAQAQSQKNQAEYTQLLATQAGVITGVEAEVGQVLSAGMPVVRLAHDGPRDAVFSVAEAMALTFKKGMPLKATLLSNGQTLKGVVREVAASADPVTRTYAVKVALQDSDRVPLGASLNVHASQMPGSAPTAIKLPTSALRQEGQNTVVWLLDEATMTVNTQPVQPGALEGNEVVISSGLKLGQKVVAAGTHVLAPGQKVTVYSTSGKAVTP